MPRPRRSLRRRPCVYTPVRAAAPPSPAAAVPAAPFCAALMIVFWVEKLFDPARRDPLGDVHL